MTEIFKKLAYTISKPHSSRHAKRKGGSSAKTNPKNKKRQKIIRVLEIRWTQGRTPRFRYYSKKSGGDEEMTDKKLEQSIVYVLKKQPVEILRLVKLIYLSDYIYSKTFGHKKSFTGAYVREKWGPMPTNFYPVFNDMKRRGIVGRDGNVVTLKKNSPTNLLSEEELACLDKVLRDFEDISTNKVMKTAYGTEPMLKIIELETSLSGEKLVGEEIDFKEIEPNPLLVDQNLDISFMDNPEFIANLKDA